MVQDIPEQDIVMEEEEQFFPPQMDPKPEMGTAPAEAAVYDTYLPHQNPPPIPAETVHLSAPDMAQLFAMLAEINNDMDAMEANTQTLRGEMQRIGRGLQAGTARMLAITGEKMVPPRAATNELKGSAPAGEDKIIRETGRTRSVKVTVTRGKIKLGDGNKMYRDTGDWNDREKTTRWERGWRRTRTHTHTGSEGQWG